MSILDMIRKWFNPSPRKKQSKPGDRAAWIVRGDRVYHLYPGYPSCKRNGKTPIQTTVGKARAQGLRECGMCQEMLYRAGRP